MKALKPIEGLALLAAMAALSSWFRVLEHYMHPAFAATIWVAGMIGVLRYVGLIGDQSSE